ncbi:MAG: thioredoxin family protein [Nanoarchaeota archaeon]
MSLIMFYGTECVHCHEMMPMVEKLEKELKVKVERVETWHNAANAQKLAKCDKDRCGGVPLFYNDKTDKYICGSCEYEDLKKWAKG